MSGDARARWIATLDACADRLEATRQQLVSVRSDAPAAADPMLFVPPSDLPPCPADLEPRLRQLQAEVAATIELANRTLDGLTPVEHAQAPRYLAHAADASWMDTRL